MKLTSKQLKEIYFKVDGTWWYDAISFLTGVDVPDTDETWNACGIFDRKMNTDQKKCEALKLLARYNLPAMPARSEELFIQQHTGEDEVWLDDKSESLYFQFYDGKCSIYNQIKAVQTAIKDNRLRVYDGNFIQSDSHICSIDFMKTPEYLMSA